jgi:hypothetical protein
MKTVDAAGIRVGNALLLVLCAWLVAATTDGLCLAGGSDGPVRTSATEVYIAVNAKYSSITGDPEGLELLRKAAGQVIARACQRAGLKPVSQQPSDLSVELDLQVALDMSGAGPGTVSMSVNIDSPIMTPVVSSRGSVSFTGQLRFTDHGKSLSTDLSGKAALLDESYMYESQGLAAFEVVCGESNLLPAICERLAKVKGRNQLELLVAALRDPDSAVRKQAAARLHDAGWNPATEADRAYLMRALRRWQDCATIGMPAREPLILALNDANGRIVIEASKGIMMIGSDAVEPLISLAKDTRARWVPRATALSVLGRVKDARAVGPAIQLLGDQDSQVRTMAAWALGELGDRRAIEPLKKLLQTEKDDTVTEQVRESIEALAPTK